MGGYTSSMLNHESMRFVRLFRNVTRGIRPWFILHAKRYTDAHAVIGPSAQRA